MDGFVLAVAASLFSALLVTVGSKVLAWLRVRAHNLLLVKLARAVKRKYPTLGATNLEKEYIRSIKDLRRPMRYGFLGLRKAEANDLPVKELVKVFQKAVKKQDRLVMFKIAIMSMGETKAYKAHYENLMDELRKDDEEANDLTAKHVEMAAVCLVTTAWAIHPILLLEQKSAYHLTLAELLFPKRVWKRETSVVREKSEK